MEKLGLYIHWPFCVSKCPYCDFNSHVRAKISTDLWRVAYLKDLDHFHKMTEGRTITSIFFGGGTPSLMPPELIEAILTHVHKKWDVAPNLEITLEANPNSVDQGRFQGYRQAGVNRLSLGIQSFQPETLKFLGRAHSVSEAHRALEIVQKTFDRYSFDLIYAHPNHTPAEWMRELETALPYAKEHLSLYQLTIEPNTAFYQKYHRGDWVLPDEKTSVQFYEQTDALLAAHGIDRYEISNYARTGAESQHNLTYWKYEDYIGVGPGAHGRLTLAGEKHALRQHRVPEMWLKKVEEDGAALTHKIKLEKKESFQETLLMGARLSEGVPLERLEQWIDKPFWAHVGAEKKQHLEDEGYLFPMQDRLCLTKAGQIRLNSVLDYILNTKLL